MSQAANLCRNKVQAELKEEIELCRDIAEEVCEEDCRDTLDSIATLIKADGNGTVRPEKFQFLEKWKNSNFDYKIVISVKNPKFSF